MSVDTCTERRAAEATLRVLVVDDETGFAQAFSRRLELMGFEVAMALNKEEALTQYREYDVLFIDLALGLASGHDLATQILSVQKQKWIFLMSAHEDWLNRSVKSDLQTLGSYSKPIKDAEEDDIRSQLNSLRNRKQLRDDAVSGLVDAFRACAAAASTDAIISQLELARAKRIVESDLLPVTRRRKSSGVVSSRRSITLMIWAATSRLSFVPSDRFGFVVPTSSMLQSLSQCAEVLGQSSLDVGDENLVDRMLRSAGLSMATKDTPLSRPDLTVSGEGESTEPGLHGGSMTDARDRRPA